MECKDEVKMDGRSGRRVDREAFEVLRSQGVRHAILDSITDDHLMTLGEACADIPPAAPGTLLAADRSGILVACGTGAYRIRELQLEGRKRLSAAEVLNSRADLFAPGVLFDH